MAGAAAKFRRRYPDFAVQVTAPDELLLVPMDATLMEQVLFNLLENAVLHAEGMTQLGLKVTAAQHQAIFEVLDDGCGISEDRRQNLFSGYRGEQEAVADGRRRNTGIGLSVCATIVRAHGGEIHGENRPSGGARFWFALDYERMSEEEENHDE